MKRMMFDFGVVVDTDDPVATQEDMVRRINATLSEGPYQFMGGSVTVTNTNSREVTPKMMKLAEVLVDSIIDDAKKGQETDGGNIPN